MPNTPDAQRRVKEALESIGRGTDTSGVILELRRKDNGKPIWIQWWSKAAPDGSYTRTMFIDITDRVLMEQEKARLQQQNVYLQEEIKTDYNFEEIIGASSGLLRILEDVTRVAATHATVLVLGETGTGKELIARAIHSTSQRADKPFIKVNCAALPAGLVESELFGHEKGAFSGALQRRIGRFELAHGGTIFLDEIGELDAGSQVKLLRVLQDRTFEVLGSSRPRTVDVRVIAATNRALHELVQRGEFREDLLYRLNLINIHLPPLRDRRSDVPRLANHFLALANEIYRAGVDAITPRAMEWLKSQNWPGNIRQLRQTIDRAVLIRDRRELDVDDFLAIRDFAAHETKDVSLPEAGTITLDEMEKRMIEKCMKHYDGNVSRVAEALGLSRAALYRRFEKYGIEA